MKIKNMKYFAKGKRSKVYIGIYNNKKVAIKVSKQASKETKWLKILNKYNIGPKVYFCKNNNLVYEFIDGKRIVDWLPKHNKKEIKKILKQVFDECRIMDKLKINKLEMHNPYKHIIIKNNVARLIDFERVYKTKKPKNVTQFAQFVMSDYIFPILKKKGFKINKKELIKILKIYKKEETKANFNKILLKIT